MNGGALPSKRTRRSARAERRHGYAGDVLRGLGIAGAGLLGVFLAASPASASGGSAQPERARYLFLLRGVPVGAITLELDHGRYRYTSEHLFTRGKQRSSKTRSARYVVDAHSRERKSGRVLESLWLWHRPTTQGCVDGVEELGTRSGRLCAAPADEGDSDRVRGTIFGEPFSATYEHDRLAELRLSDAQFLRIGDRERPNAPPDLFGAGWPIHGAYGALSIEGAPTLSNDDGGALLPLKSAFRNREELEAQVAAAHAELKSNADAFCTEFVARFLKEALASGHTALVVHGVVAEPDSQRAFPHVWIRARLPEGLVDVDPTLLQPVTPETHAPLAVVAPSEHEQAGRAWLDLFTGRAKVVRRR